MLIRPLPSPAFGLVRSLETRRPRIPGESERISAQEKGEGKEARSTCMSQDASSVCCLDNYASSVSKSFQE